MNTKPIDFTGPAPTITQGTKKMPPTLYLCGPISERSDADCNDWRSFVKTSWPGSCLDPMDRDARGVWMDCDKAAAIVNSDLADIANCDALLVHYDRPSIGTSMEIFYAATALKKPVFLINRSGKPYHELSPWLIHHINYSCEVLNDEVLAQIWNMLTRV